VLVFLDLDKEFRVEADISNYTTGKVLSIKCSNELWKPVAFISKSLSDTEWNYGIHDKEILSQTSFGHISINSPSILTVSMATESP